MRNLIETVKSAIGDMRYDSNKAVVGVYWFIRVACILIPILVVLIIIGLIYMKVKGISFVMPF